MKLLKSLIILNLLGIHLICYSQIEVFNLNLHGEKKKIAVESLIMIPNDSLNNLIIKSINDISWEATYEGLLINKVMLTAKAYMLYDSTLLQSGFLRVLDSDSELTNCLSHAHDRIFNVLNKQLIFPNHQLYLFYTFIILQNDSHIKNDSIFVSSNNKWGYKAVTVLINLDKRKSRN